MRQVDLGNFDWSQFRGAAEILSGGPPCQPWSQAGKGLGEDDERDLLGSMPSAVRMIQPDAFVFENVVGLLTGENEAYARKLIQDFRDACGRDSYGVALGVFNAADFGVPQSRRRVFIVGARGKPTPDVHAYFDRVFSLRTRSRPNQAAALDLEPWLKIGDVVTDWAHPKSKWRRWPVIEGFEESQAIIIDDRDSKTRDNRLAKTNLRIGLAWASRGSAVVWRQDGWCLLPHDDASSAANCVPLLPSDGDAGNPQGDPWIVIGDPPISLDALRRQIGREARLVYVDLPRIATNAKSFDAADRESILDTWLSVARSTLRRALAKQRREFRKNCL